MRIYLSAFHTIYVEFELLHPTYRQQTFLSISAKCATGGFITASS